MGGKICQLPYSYSFIYCDPIISFTDKIKFKNSRNHVTIGDKSSLTGEIGEMKCVIRSLFFRFTIANELSIIFYLYRHSLNKNSNLREWRCQRNCFLINQYTFGCWAVDGTRHCVTSCFLLAESTQLKFSIIYTESNNCFCFAFFLLHLIFHLY